jgi:M6 family metalloprotease-like protein
MLSNFGEIGRACKFTVTGLAGLVLLAFTTSAAYAVPANPHPFTEMQPDGTSASLRVRGDEHFNWTEDTDGYTVLYHKGWYEYARLNPQGRLVPTGLKVGKDNPKANGLDKGLLPSAANRVAGGKGGSAEAPQGTLAAGSIRNLVVLIQFSNHAGRALPTSSEIDVLFNATAPDPVLAPTGSVRQLYLENSYGALELNSDISSWITVSGTEQYYANGYSGDSTLWEALREALDALDATVDFSQYDNDGDGYIDSIAFLHSGFGAEWGGTDEDGTASADRIWSHRWVIQNPEWTSAEGVRVANYHISPALWGKSGSSIGRIGVIAHETGHFFGLPDLYDTDGGGSGIGSYGLMANSWDFQGTQLCPPHLSPWSKMQLGWIDPQTISGPGEYSLAQSETNDEYFMVSDGFPGSEYLLIENRQNAGFDCTLPQGGLAIWHIDDEASFNTEGYPGQKRWPRNGKHYRVALAQADGDFDLERGFGRGDAYDLHHGGAIDAMAPGPDGHPNTDGYQSGQITLTGHTISHISASAPLMTFCLNGCGGDGGGGGETGGGFNPPSNLQASVTTSGSKRNQVKNVSLSWADNSSDPENEDLFVIERCEETGKGKSKTCAFAEYDTVGPDTTGYNDVTDGATYMYRVKARRSGSSDSDYSNEVKI